MTEIDSSRKRTLYNWMNDNIITQETAKMILDSGKVPKGKFKGQLVSYSSLQQWGVV